MEEKRLRGIRGATTCENTPESIQQATAALCRELFARNALRADDIVSMQFTLTPDLTVLNPATALRRSDTGLDTSAIPLFCSQEAVIEGMLPRVIRVLVTAYCAGSAVPVFQNDARTLRPDLSATGGK